MIDPERDFIEEEGDARAVNSFLELHLIGDPTGIGEELLGLIEKLKASGKDLPAASRLNM